MCIPSPLCLTLGLGEGAVKRAAEVDAPTPWYDGFPPPLTSFPGQARPEREVCDKNYNRNAARSTTTEVPDVPVLDRSIRYRISTPDQGKEEARL
ncbi:5'-nucleotidase [Anopheles sinensis]|uniref:5'-nucleotidase n=1 Tax=Anopheles sinensis TaxID=74873 RepID=A0A084WFE8_ANOSI|nr:5'-nucleotidase [Anopheles sinensis]